jgi:hypothetical protein
MYSWQLEIQVGLGTDHLTWRGGYGFLFRSEFFFRTTQELEYLFFVAQGAIGYFNYTHNLSNFTLYQPQANVLPTLKTTLKDLVI